MIVFDKKKQRIITAVIAVVLVAAMVIPTVLSFLIR